MSRFLHYFQKYVLFIGVINFLLLSVASAANRTIDLHIAYKTVNFSGESTKAIAINDQIPGPTLHFKEGDHVTINVYNDLDKGTAIHWHGLIIPWRMDGVDGVSQKPIAPGSVFHYEFTLKQSGTYWYHAHAGFQEQAGAYGGMIIDPIHKRRYPNAKDAVIVLSDWSNALGRQVYYNLKKEGDYYSSKFPIQPSLVKFIRDYSRATPEERKQLVSDYKMMQDMRMSIYDISDVAYDAFLLNGKSNKEPWTRLVKVGDTVRLRFIGAAGSTIFQVKIPDVEMRMVQVQGHAIPPKIVKEFTIAPGETYDILVKIRKKSPVIIYAESTDTVGAALGALITEPNQIVDYKSVQPFPEPKPVSMMGPMDHSMGTMNHSTGSMNMSSMSHHHHTMPSGPYKTTGTKYQNLKAIH
ncbi:MAG: multicopper oxidase domain-containing protein, partial [Proteobacteria bacterium]|nr:multicopper oxidase domain-containing protein [Pseudomonadota bacterium]